MPAGAGGPVAGTLRPAADVPETASGRAARQLPWRTLLAAAGGLVLVLGFPAYDLSALAVLGPAALALAVRGRRFRAGLWLGLDFGLAFFVPLLSWTGIYVGPLPWLALAVWEALHLALLGGATALTSRLTAWPLWAAALWVADEAVRGRFVLGGFPWGRLGFSQTSGPLLSLAAYGGVPLVSFAVALTGTLLAAAVIALHRAWQAAGVPGERGPALRAAALSVVAVLAVPLVGALAWLPLPGASLTAGGPTKTVAVVQGNVPRAVHQQHGDRVGPRDRPRGHLRQAASGAAGRVRAGPRLLPLLQRRRRPGDRPARRFDGRGAGRGRRPAR